MRQVVSFLRRWPRTSAALLFGIAGTALSMVWWLPAVFKYKSLLVFVLFIVAPGISAAVAGFVLGKPLPDARPINAALRGAIISSFALVLFAPVFATLYVLTQRANEHWTILDLTLLVLMVSAILVGWVVVLVGAAVGWGLHRILQLN
jgi:hypothetical protein